MSAIFGLAPMEGVSEWAFRLWMAQASRPAFMSTPFLRATDSFPRQLPADFAPELRHKLPYKLIPQIMAARAEDFIRSAKLLLDAGAEFVDLNCGCPSPNPVSGGAGSSLLKSTETFLDFIKTIHAALGPGSYSVKMRTGFHDTKSFSQMIEGLAELPLRQLTIHGRTREDRYDGEARWDLIHAAQERLPFPVIASGDIVSSQSWQQKQLQYPRIQRIIIGRGALRNPWIFEELRTGQEIGISTRTIRYSLACLGLMTDIAAQQSDRLEELVAAGLWQQSAGVDADAWETLWRALVNVKGSSHIERFAFGRVKMLWNSLRSSLPAAYFSPQLLRSRSLEEFLDGIEALGNDDLELKHQHEWDWLYTSSKKKPTLMTPSLPE